MNKDKFQKIKYVKMLEILRQESDENRPITTNALVAKLNAIGVKINRKTLYEDIAVLNEQGYEVMCRKERSNNYYIVDRKFDVPELRILMDAVEAANFITESKTRELQEKIANLGGSYRAKLLKRNRNCFNTNKHSNESIYYNISTIDDAIIHKNQLSFNYFNYNENGERVLRNDGNRYEVSPLATIYTENNYYLIAYYEKYLNISNFRIDRMNQVNKEDKVIIENETINNFDINKHRKQAFCMFTGEEIKVALQFDKSLIDVIFDKFGEKTKLTAIGNDIFSVAVNVQLSPMFYGWCCGFGNKLKLISPEIAVKDMKNQIDKIIELYK